MALLSAIRGGRRLTLGRLTLGRLLLYIVASLTVILLFRSTWNMALKEETFTPPKTWPVEPPVKQRIQQSIQQTTSDEAKELARKIDEKHCGTSPCRFLLPVAITEQESKAQLHFRHIAFLSGDLHRTIVLPNVFGSHLGVCRHHPFSYYYSLSWLNNNSNQFSYIALDRFQEWLTERNEAGLKPTQREHYIQANRNWIFLSKEENCFAHLLDNAGLSAPKRTEVLDPLPIKRKYNMTQRLLDVLKDGKMEEVNGNPWEVVSLFYDRRFPFIDNPAASVPLTYASHWITTATKLATQLTPFVAIHWRMERVEQQENLRACAETLVRYLRTHILSSPSTIRTPNIFLLTDYPHLLNASTGTESQSFKGAQLTSYHHDAIAFLHENLNLSLTVLEYSRRPIPYDQLPKENWNLLPVAPAITPVDSSVLGIVDKLVAMRAQWFLAGKPVECAKESSFTLRIMKERTARWKAGDKGEQGEGIMRNKWELFGVNEVSHAPEKVYPV